MLVFYTSTSATGDSRDVGVFVHFVLFCSWLSVLVLVVGYRLVYLHAASGLQAMNALYHTKSQLMITLAISVVFRFCRVLAFEWAVGVRVYYVVLEEGVAFRAPLMATRLVSEFRANCPLIRGLRRVMIAINNSSRYCLRLLSRLHLHLTPTLQFDEGSSATRLSTQFNENCFTGQLLRLYVRNAPANVVTFLISTRNEYLAHLFNLSVARHDEVLQR